ncbi:MAG: peptide chain release factor N(5)-glutamine methyltransferase [Alphaproteobacteria bacterium]|jgi:release factor glutamine methyltransferase|nr:peptide chain release factor N(5)-glutamine methyltransferase [Alphaproteobacteria bacterium]
MTKTIKSLQKKIAEKLSPISKEEASLESKIILSYILGIKENELFLFGKKKLSILQKIKLNIFLKKRLRGIPLYKIIGRKEFYNSEFITTKNVLDPRSETEILVDDIVSKNDKKKPLSILEFGVGSGCIMLSLLKHFKNAKGLGFDISKKAVKIANKNSNLLKVSDRFLLKNKSWNYLSDKDFDKDQKFDLIISNPPYIKSGDVKDLQLEVKKYDPMFALDGGNDGLNCYRDIAKVIKDLDLLSDSTGKIYLEIGGGQESDIEEIFSNNGFKLEETIKDFSDIIRILIFSK